MYVLYKQIETYNSKSQYFSEFQSFLPVQNNWPIIDAINRFSIILVLTLVLII